MILLEIEIIFIFYEEMKSNLVYLLNKGNICIGEIMFYFNIVLELNVIF